MVPAAPQTRSALAIRKRPWAALAEAHDHLVAAGAKCDAAGFAAETEWQGYGIRRRKVSAGNLAKMLAGERAEKAALIATLTDIVPRLDQLTKRVEDIARTPLPPLAMIKKCDRRSQSSKTPGASADSRPTISPRPFPA